LGGRGTCRYAKLAQGQHEGHGGQKNTAGIKKTQVMGFASLKEKKGGDHRGNNGKGKKFRGNWFDSWGRRVAKGGEVKEIPTFGVTIMTEKRKRRRRAWNGDREEMAQTFFWQFTRGGRGGKEG